jgi:ferrous iron transport protein B
MFFCISSGIYSSLFSAIILTLVIIFGLCMTFLVTKLLSATVLKGSPSSYTLELPPYRKPQIVKVIVRSIFDRTLFVLGRAVSVAAPAGLIIWLMANIHIHDISVLSHCANFLDPFAKLMGLDGVILIAFILGFPANEIVIPIIIMAYMQTGSLTELSSTAALYDLFISNGWTFITAVSVILFSLLHWPCSTTVLTIKKETGSIKWTAVAVLLPTVISIVVCILFNFIANLVI